MATKVNNKKQATTGKKEVQPQVPALGYTLSEEQNVALSAAVVIVDILKSVSNHNHDHDYVLKLVKAIRQSDDIWLKAQTPVDNNE